MPTKNIPRFIERYHIQWTTICDNEQYGEEHNRHRSVSVHVPTLVMRMLVYSNLYRRTSETTEYASQPPHGDKALL